MGYRYSSLLFIGEEELGVVLFYLEKIKKAASIYADTAALPHIADVPNDKTHNQADEYEVVCEDSEFKLTKEPRIQEYDTGDNNDALKDQGFLHSHYPSSDER